MNPISITVRPGDAQLLNLGSSTTAPLLSYLREFSEYIIGVETVNGKKDSLHLQVGINTTKLQKNVRRRLIGILQKAGWNEKQLKHGLKVKCHDSWQVLASYCSKQTVYDMKVTSLGDDFEFYCKLYHDDDYYDSYMSELLDQLEYHNVIPFPPPVRNYDGAPRDAVAATRADNVDWIVKCYRHMNGH